MISRARRAVPAAATALVILAVCVLTAVAVLQRLTGHRPFVSFAALADYGHRLHLDDTPVLVAGGIAAALGLILLACALLPGRPTVLPLTDPAAEPGTADRPGMPTRAGVRRSGLARALRSGAAGIEGVTGARVRVRRRAVSIRLRTPNSDTDSLTGTARAVLDGQLAHTELAGPMTLRLRVSRTRRRDAE